MLILKSSMEIWKEKEDIIESINYIYNFKTSSLFVQKNLYTSGDSQSLFFYKTNFMKI